MTENEFQMNMNQSKYHKQGVLSLINTSWKYASIGYEKGINECACWAATCGHKDIIEFLLSDPELKVHANIHTQDDFLFQSSLKKSNKDILQFLIFDMKIEKTEKINNIINNLKNLENSKSSLIRQQTEELTSTVEIDEMFKQRDLQNTKSSKIKP
jgi:hypothetical protein